MIGRPRRRHAVDNHGRIHRQSHHTSISRSTPAPGRQPRYQSSPAVSQWLKFGTIGLAAIVGIFLLWAIVGSIITYGRVTDTNSTKQAPGLQFHDIGPDKLQGEGDGRVNVLLIGIGGDKHPGGKLADTIMVASFDPKNKEAALLSLPRDLYVPINGNGSAKINAAHAYGEQNSKKFGSGPAVLKKTVADILDLPIHYYIRVDFTALEKIVDTLGGVTVDVERPINDQLYPADNMIDYAPFRLAAGSQTLNGKTALKYARSRHASGGEGSDFARARRQQKLLSAIKSKALSLGILTNPKKISEIIGILGSHIKTDLTLKEMERFMQIWKSVDESKIITKVLDNGPGGPLIASSGDERGYILLPRAGDFSEIQQIAHEIFTDPYLREEKASIAVVNATGTTLAGQQVMQQLKSYGYQVTDITLKNQEKSKSTQLIDVTQKKPYTKKFLESRFKTKAIVKKDSASSYDLILTVGSDYQLTKIKTSKPSLPKASPSVSPLATQSPKAIQPTGSPNVEATD